MDKFYELWKPVLKSFKEHHPDLHNDMVDWYPSGYLEITVKLVSGRKIAYEFIGNSIRILRDASSIHDGEFNENAWRSNFAQRLRIRMIRQGISQDRLANMTGISRVTLTKYMNGQASPSGYNLERLCRAFGCSISELTSMK